MKEAKDYAKGKSIAGYKSKQVAGIDQSGFYSTTLNTIEIKKPWNVLVFLYFEWLLKLYEYPKLIYRSFVNYSLIISNVSEK